MRDSRRSPQPQSDDVRFHAAAAPPAFELVTVVDQFQTPLLRYVGQILGPDSGDAEEVVEDTFLRFHRQVSRHGRESISNLAGWLFRVAHNLARDVGRRRKRQKKLQDDVMSDPTLQATCSSHTETPGVELARREAYELAMTELRRLPDAEQNILLLKLIQGLTLREISEVTGMRLSTVHYRLNRGLQSLSGRLSELGLV